MGYDGARIVMTVLTWPLDLARLAATADRCAHFQTFFDPSTAPGIPMTTTRLQTSRPDALVYQQTMRLNNVDSSVYFAFENIGRMAVFGIAFPYTEPVHRRQSRAAADVSGHRGQTGRSSSDRPDGEVKTMKIRPPTGPATVA